MGGAEVLTLIILFFLLIINIVYCVKTKNKIKIFIFSTCSGIITLIPTVFLLNFFGFAANINVFSVFISFVLGVPGVVLIATTALF